MLIAYKVIAVSFIIVACFSSEFPNQGKKTIAGSIHHSKAI
jgi:hypothetical protein